MREELAKLKQLQKVDAKLSEIEALRGNLPQEVERLEKEKDETKEVIKSHEKRIKEIDLETRKLEGDIKQASAKLKKYQDQLYAVTTNKEYDALTHELEAMKSAISESENQIFELLKEKEDKESANKTAIAELEDLKNELKLNKKELVRKINETKHEEKEHQTEREKIIPEVSKSLLSRYERIKKARNGTAVVPVTGETCGGCFHKVPPQVVVEIRQMNRIINCESCGRFLVVE